MAIYGIGHDIVENKRIENLVNQYGQKFINRVLSKNEQEILASRTDKFRFIAKRFAAKEAFAKACKIGLRYPILMPNISVTNDSLGSPAFVFNNEIAEWLKKNQIQSHHLTVSDEINLSSAYVILETF